MKLAEVTSAPELQYFLDEGCAIFAIVLWKILGAGNFYIYADFSDQADKWGRSGFEYTHALLGIGNRLYDVRGVRSLADLAQEFNKDPSGMRLLGPFSEQDFYRQFIGNSDRKPFYGPTPDTVQEAEAIIRASPSLYGVRE